MGEAGVGEGEGMGADAGSRDAVGAFLDRFGLGCRSGREGPWASGTEVGPDLDERARRRTRSKRSCSAPSVWVEGGVTAVREALGRAALDGRVALVEDAHSLVAIFADHAMEVVEDRWQGGATLLWRRRATPGEPATSMAEFLRGVGEVPFDRAGTGDHPLRAEGGLPALRAVLRDLAHWAGGRRRDLVEVRLDPANRATGEAARIALTLAPPPGVGGGRAGSRRNATGEAEAGSLERRVGDAVLGRFAPVGHRWRRRAGPANVARGWRAVPRSMIVRLDRVPGAAVLRAASAARRAAQARVGGDRLVAWLEGVDPLLAQAVRSEADAGRQR